MPASLFTRSARLAASGTIGVLIVEGTRSLVRRGAPRRGAVVATSWALRGARRAEVHAESARLVGADVLAEARDRIGEPNPVPGTPPRHDHQH